MPEMTLGKDSSDKEISNWVSKCISTRQHENPNEENDQSIRICFEMARKATGKQIRQGGK